MKTGNVSNRLKQYRRTLNTLYHPLVLITQLFIAYFRDYISRYYHTRNGVPRAYMIFIKQLGVCVIYGTLMFMTGNQRIIRTRRLPFLILTAVLQVFIAQHLFVKSQILNAPLTTAIWQMIVPAIATSLTMYIGFEPATFWKAFGCILCFLAAIGRLVYNSFVDIDDDLFLHKFFLILQVISLATGVVMQKKMIDKNNCSLLVLGFYVYLFASICSFLTYTVMFINFNTNEEAFIDIAEPYEVFFNIDYIVNILRILAIYICLCFSEAFTYMVIMYFVKKASVSKATLFGALHAVFVLVLKLIFDPFPTQDKIFWAIVTVAYLCIFQEKYKAGKGKKEQSQKVVFKRHLSVDAEVGKMISGGRIKVGGKYFYDSQSVTSTLNPALSRRLSELNYGHSPRSRMSNFELSFGSTPREESKDNLGPKNEYWILKGESKIDLDFADFLDSRGSQYQTLKKTHHATDLGVINATIKEKRTLKNVNKEFSDTYGSINNQKF